MTNPCAGLESIDLFSPDVYAAEGYPHADWARLRREAPVFWYPRNKVQPFWAITRHADIVWISRQPERFPSGPNSVEIPADLGIGEFELPPTIISMDPPLHGIYRQLLSRRFTPRAPPLRTNRQRSTPTDCTTRAMISDVEIPGV